MTVKELKAVLEAICDDLEIYVKPPRVVDGLWPEMESIKLVLSAHGGPFVYISSVPDDGEPGQS